MYMSLNIRWDTGAKSSTEYDHTCSAIFITSLYLQTANVLETQLSMKHFSH